MKRPAERSPKRVATEGRLRPSVLVLLLGAALPGWTQPAAPAAPSSAAPAPAASPARVQVQSFAVSGNTLLSAAAIDAALAPYLGLRSLDELKQAALAVQALYRDAGYGAVVAFVPEQASPGGQVAIQVVEGRVSRVVVSGQQQFSEADIRASLPSLVEGATPRVREIDAQIQLANENPAKEIEVLLQPGARPGEVEARVKVSEQPVSRWTIGADNTGNPTTGRLRANLGWQHAGLGWGASRDHVLALQFQMAPEHPDAVAVLSANYRIPLYAAGLAIDAYAAYSDVDGGTTATAAGPLQFAGKGHIAGLRLSKYLPRLGEVDQRLVVGLDHRDYINSCTIVGAGAEFCGNAGASVSVQPLTLEYTAQKGGSTPLGLSIGLQHNLQLGGGHAGDANFEAVRRGAKPRYTLLRFGLFGGTALGEQWQLQGRLIGQLSRDALVPGEQFGIGGASSVRGYDEREVTGDSGVSGSLELLGPDLLAPATAAPGTRGSLRPALFADAGRVSNRPDGNPEGTPCRQNQTRCSLGSLGVGLRYASGPLALRLDLAHATRDGNRTGRHDTYAHVSLSYSF